MEFSSRKRDVVLIIGYNDASYLLAESVREPYDA
jgi:hypothetical protein